MMPERSVENHAHRLRIDQESAQAFWTDLGPISEALEIRCELGGGMRGPWMDSFEFKEFEEFRKLSRHAPTLRVAADLIASRSPPGRVPVSSCIIFEF